MLKGSLPEALYTESKKILDEEVELAGKPLRKWAWLGLIMAVVCMLLYILVIIVTWQNSFIFGYGPQIWLLPVLIGSLVVLLINYNVGKLEAGRFSAIFGYYNLICLAWILFMVAVIICYIVKFSIDSTNYCGLVMAGTLNWAQYSNVTNAGFVASPAICLSGNIVQFWFINIFAIVMLAATIVMLISVIYIMYYTGAWNSIVGRTLHLDAQRRIAMAATSEEKEAISTAFGSVLANIEGNMEAVTGSNEEFRSHMNFHRGLKGVKGQV